MNISIHCNGLIRIKPTVIVLFDPIDPPWTLGERKGASMGSFVGLFIFFCSLSSRVLPFIASRNILIGGGCRWCLGTKLERRSTYINFVCVRSFVRCSLTFDVWGNELFVQTPPSSLPIAESVVWRHTIRRRRRRCKTHRFPSWWGSSWRWFMMLFTVNGKRRRCSMLVPVATGIKFCDLWVRFNGFFWSVSNGESFVAHVRKKCGPTRCLRTLVSCQIVAFYVFVFDWDMVGLFFFSKRLFFKLEK